LTRPFVALSLNYFPFKIYSRLTEILTTPVVEKTLLNNQTFYEDTRLGGIVPRPVSVTEMV